MGLCVREGCDCPIELQERKGNVQRDKQLAEKFAALPELVLLDLAGSELSFWLTSWEPEVKGRHPRPSSSNRTDPPTPSLPPPSRKKTTAGSPRRSGCQGLKPQQPLSRRHRSPDEQRSHQLPSANPPPSRGSLVSSSPMKIAQRVP
ncbi:hypothetical protein E2C01_051592 [Portunus trituberculatus]|uniref:Uncharacterized protein n=1 Tax=Portunus trituberculatus TaxID=210409 RepID=A0A5B7GJZ6_PORTR|nr:hypothetical protein [Portunus trituberculatus]